MQIVLVCGKRGPLQRARDRTRILPRSRRLSEESRLLSDGTVILLIVLGSGSILVLIVVRQIFCRSLENQLWKPGAQSEAPKYTRGPQACTRRAQLWSLGPSTGTCLVCRWVVGPRVACLRWEGAPPCATAPGTPGMPGLPRYTLGRWDGGGDLGDIRGPRVCPGSRLYPRFPGTPGPPS